MRCAHAPPRRLRRAARGMRRETSRGRWSHEVRSPRNPLDPLASLLPEQVMSGSAERQAQILLALAVLAVLPSPPCRLQVPRGLAPRQRRISGWRPGVVPGALGPSCATLSGARCLDSILRERVSRRPGLNPGFPQHLDRPPLHILTHCPLSSAVVSASALAHVASTTARHTFTGQTALLSLGPRSVPPPKRRPLATCQVFPQRRRPRIQGSRSAMPGLCRGRTCRENASSLPEQPAVHASHPRAPPEPG